MDSELTWDEKTGKKFEQMIAKIPGPLQSVAREAVLKKAQGFAGGDSRSQMNEKDLVDAFFEATPFGFHGPLKTDMEAIEIDYTKYGHPK